MSAIAQYRARLEDAARLEAEQRAQEEHRAQEVEDEREHERLREVERLRAAGFRGVQEIDGIGLWEHPDWRHMLWHSEALELLNIAEAGK